MTSPSPAGCHDLLFIRTGEEEEGADFFVHSPDLLVVLDGRGRVLRLNPSAARTCGHAPATTGAASPAEPARSDGVRWTRFVHPDDISLVRARVRALARGGSISGLDCRVYRADGGLLHVRWSIALDRRTKRMYALGRDCTREAPSEAPDPIPGDAELRHAVASELHDGVLQALTAAGLQLEVARRLLETDADAAREIIDRLGYFITEEQREIRLFVDEIKLQEPFGNGGAPPLTGRLAAMLGRIDAIWGVSTRLEGRITGRFDAPFERCVVRVVQEAVLNAARHGDAANVRVRATVHGGHMALRIVDDGCGFPFQGELDDRDLRERRLGPVILKKRVTEAGGTIAIRSTSGGASLHIELPLAGTCS